MTVTDPKIALSVAKAAHLNGGTRLTYCSTEWDVSGSCTDPTHIELAGRLPQEYSIRIGGDWDTIKGLPTANKMRPHYVDMAVPCRKCASCKSYRAALWQAKASKEFEFALPGRSWFVTLTFRPDVEYRLRATARAKERANARPGTKNKEEKYYESAAYDEVQLALKRLRETAGPFRRLVVAENHKSGVIHYHAILHEQVGHANRVQKRHIQESWARNGFSSAKLCDEKAIKYVTKYLTKADGTYRIRASRFYGEPLTAFSRRQERIALKGNSDSSHVIDHDQRGASFPPAYRLTSEGESETSDEIPF